MEINLICIKSVQALKWNSLKFIMGESYWNFGGFHFVSHRFTA
jgi:hypothetical protein